MNTPNHNLRGWLTDLAALIAGTLIAFSLAPYNYWVLGVLAIAIFAFALLDATPKRCFFRSFLFGAGMYGAGTSWVYVSIHNFGYASGPLAFFLTSVFVLGLAAVFALPYYFYGRYFSANRHCFIFGFAAIWVLGEWLRSWLLTGFPWLYLGYAHIDTWLAGWAPVVGVFGVSFIVALTGTALATFILTPLSPALTTRRTIPPPPEKSWRQLQIILTASLLLWLSGYGLQAKKWTHYDAQDALQVTLVQPNIPQEMKWQPLYRPLIMQTLRDLTSQHWGSDIIIWPEAAIPLMFHEADSFIEELQLRAEASNTALLSGVLFDSYEPNAEYEPYTFYNSIVGLGEAQGIYFKQRLVPFGEYVPLEKWLRGLIAFFDLPNSVISGGPSNQKLIATEDYQIATYICYEVVYPDLVAAYAKDAEILVTISNDAWFGASIGPIQHLQMAQMRALENGRYMLRATNTGVSSIISERGEQVLTLEQFKQTSTTGEAFLTHGTTPYTRTGSYPIIFLCLAIIGMLAWNNYRQTRQKQNIAP